jgi:hypothetical protein
MLKMEGEEEGQGETRRWSRMEVKKWIVTLERPLQPKCKYESGLGTSEDGKSKGITRFRELAKGKDFAITEMRISSTPQKV